MSPRVKINDIINIIRFQSYNSTSYLDKERGELFLISKEQLIAAQEDGGLERLSRVGKGANQVSSRDLNR